MYNAYMFMRLCEEAIFSVKFSQKVMIDLAGDDNSTPKFLKRKLVRFFSRVILKHCSPISHVYDAVTFSSNCIVERIDDVEHLLMLYWLTTADKLSNSSTNGQSRRDQIVSVHFS